MISKFKKGNKKTVQRLNAITDRANRADLKKAKQLTRPAKTRGLSATSILHFGLLNNYNTTTKLLTVYPMHYNATQKKWEYVSGTPIDVVPSPIYSGYQASGIDWSTIQFDTFVFNRPILYCKMKNKEGDTYYQQVSELPYSLAVWTGS